MRRWWPRRQIVLIGDGGYAAVGLALWCSGMPHPVTLVTRLRSDAGLYAPPTTSLPGRRGPKTKKGVRLPSLAQRAADWDTVWETLTLAWYRDQPRTVLVQTDTALWYTPRHAPASIRWVLVRCPEGRFADQAFLCTDREATPTQILAWVVLRWNIEVTFEDVRAHLGVETQRQLTCLTISAIMPARCSTPKLPGGLALCVPILPFAILGYCIARLCVPAHNPPYHDFNSTR